MRRRVNEAPMGYSGAPLKQAPVTAGYALQSLDLFPKVERDFITTTNTGGRTSLVLYALIAILTLNEVITFYGVRSRGGERVRVDRSLGGRLQVNLNVTFPELSCSDVHLDAMDVAGDNQMNIDDSWVKKRLDHEGRPIKGGEMIEVANENLEAREKRERDNADDTKTKNGLPPGYCGDCYGAQESDTQCCNTCDSVLAAYSKKGWNTRDVTVNSEQCQREHRSAGPAATKKGEGCNLSGSMEVNKVAGNFHVAMGESMVRDGRHIHQFLPADAPNYNTSHIIHELSFGPKIPGNLPLDGRIRIAGDSTGLYQYFIKIVPTSYTDRKGKTTESNRFSHTERFRPLIIDVYDDEMDELGDGKYLGAHTAGAIQHSHGHEHHRVQTGVLPGVFWVYEIHPFAVEVDMTDIDAAGTWLHLFVRIMAVVGGLYTVVGWIDQFLYEMEKRGE